MSASVPRSFIEEVRDRTDLAELIGEDTQLARSGTVLKGRSPFNSDTNPSLVVWPASGRWKDYSGGGTAGGDAIDYLMMRRSLSFPEALEELARRAGLRRPGQNEEAHQAEMAAAAERRRIEDLLGGAADYYHRLLPDEIRRDWLHHRYGLTDETIDGQKIGWADGQLYRHLRTEAGCSEAEALSTGLFYRRGDDGQIRDLYRQRIIFPFWSRGRVVEMTARATEQGDDHHQIPKYLKLLRRSDRHPYVSEHRRSTSFYGEDSVGPGGEILITEGVTDCLAAIQAGWQAISPATTQFRAADADRLLRFTARAERILICNDSEASGAGEAGAIKTARLLHAAGRDVRIATIPRPETAEKIDVNDLVRTEGPEALSAVVKAARRLAQHLIERVPADTPKLDLAAELAPALELVRSAGPVEQEAYRDLLRERFGLKAATVRQLLRDDHTAEKESVQGGEIRRGQVHEGDGCYYVIGPGREHVIISSFQIEPRRRIRLDGGEIVEADLRTEAGLVHRGVRIGREAWSTRRSFIGVLDSVDLQWTGTDDHVQGVLAHVAAKKVPSLPGTTNLGYHASEAGPRWVTPDGVLGPEGASVRDDEVVFVPSGASLPGRVRYRSDQAAEKRAAQVILPALAELNEPGVMGPIIGWFFAAPSKPRISRVLGAFPILVIWGTQGSGKSSLVMKVFWPLLGVASVEPYSATETEFALLKLLSSTDSVPVFLDEYKPYDMPRRRRNVLHRYMRRIYTGEVEERGRADQTLTTYRLSAPLCIAGETRPTEPALVERLLTCNPDKNQIVQVSGHSEALERIIAAGPGRLAASIVRFHLGRDVQGDLNHARAEADRLLEGQMVPPRIRESIVVMLAGLGIYRDYARHMGVELAPLPTAEAVSAVMDDLLEGGGRAVKTGLDRFLEELSVMAISGEIESGRQFSLDGDRLALHFDSCHAAFTEHCRRIGYDGEVPDRKALRRQILEVYRRQGYVVCSRDLVSFRDTRDRRRAVVIDLARAGQELEVDGFARQHSAPLATEWDVDL